MLQMLTAIPPMSALVIAILCEVVATSLLPKTEQFTQPIPTIFVLMGYAVAFYLLAITVKVVPIGIAYAIWCGAGIVLVSMVSWLWHGQQLDMFAILGISLILAGTVIINVFSNTTVH